MSIHRISMANYATRQASLHPQHKYPSLLYSHSTKYVLLQSLFFAIYKNCKFQFTDAILPEQVCIFIFIL